MKLIVGSFVDALLTEVGNFLLYLVYWELLSWIDVGYCQMFFSVFMIMFFSYLDGDMVDYIAWTVDIERALHSQDKPYLVVVYYSFKCCWIRSVSHLVWVVMQMLTWDNCPQFVLVSVLFVSSSGIRITLGSRNKLGIIHPLLFSGRDCVELILSLL